MKNNNKDNTEKQNNNTENIDNENIKDFGIPNNTLNKNNIQFISLIGEIEGHYVSASDKKATKYEHIIPILISCQQDPAIEGVFIILNTMGGDVEAGLALSELINGINKPTVSLVLGGGHSIGVPLATSTDFSVIVPSATMTIHPLRTTGLVISGPQTFKYFQKMQQRINEFIIRTSSIEEKDLIDLMYASDQLANDIGTILVGNEAVKYGLIDSVGDFSFALSKLKEMIKTDNEKQ
ncbi:MAG: Clp protease [Tissierellia bacterium]|nr:Clp protease [Tissierellia bacterium]